MRFVLDPNDTKLGHLRVRLDSSYQASLALKADTEAALALKADNTALTATNTLLATKASQAQLDFVGQNFQPRITAFAPLSLVPRTGPQNSPFAELSVDLAAYATNAALALKADQSSVVALGQALETIELTPGPAGPAGPTGATGATGATAVPSDPSDPKASRVLRGRQERPERPERPERLDPSDPSDPLDPKAPLALDRRLPREPSLVATLSYRTASCGL
jgi:hypothetical protein